MEKAMVMEIQRYCIHDGPGIRTTVFLKGCHMRCQWCHNPESQRAEEEMMFYETRCVGCGDCLAVCERGAHSWTEGQHRIRLEVCESCSKKQVCMESCAAGALQVCGRWMDSESVLKEVLKDRQFYGEEGGVTCSGGEPLLQGDFLEEFLSGCKRQGLHTCIDTTLNVPWNQVSRQLENTDLFLVDIKMMDSKKLKQYTGCADEWTVENLKKLSERNKPVILRMPMLAGINDDDQELEERKRLMRQLHNIVRVDCFCVSDHGRGKYRALQRERTVFNVGLDEKKLIDRVRKKMCIA